MNILEELSIARNGLFFIGCNLDEKPLDPALLAFLRVLCFTKKEIDDFQGNHEKICSLSEPNTTDGKFIYFYFFSNFQIANGENYMKPIWLNFTTWVVKLCKIEYEFMQGGL